VDASPEMIAVAESKAARRKAPAQFQVAGAQSLPFPDASFDAVVTSLMLHHLPEADLLPAVGELLRVLQPGGTPIHWLGLIPGHRPGGIGSAVRNRRGSVDRRGVAGETDHRRFRLRGLGPHPPAGAWPQVIGRIRRVYEELTATSATVTSNPPQALDAC